MSEEKLVKDLVKIYRILDKLTPSGLYKAKKHIKEYFKVKEQINKD